MGHWRWFFIGVLFRFFDHLYYCEIHGKVEMTIPESVKLVAVKREKYDAEDKRWVDNNAEGNSILAESLNNNP
jgi:hypothetical protein